jgi:hypothetical protein
MKISVELSAGITVVIKVNSHIIHHTSKKLFLVFISDIYKLSWRAIKN